MISGVALALLVSMASAPTLTDEDPSMIRGFCLAAFEAAMANAGLSAPEGMARFTCDCFIEQVFQGAALNEARETCTTEAAQRFPLES